MAPARERIPYSLAARELLRNTLLDAACDELVERRWADITMADIARAAGVSRQTLYKEFGSREEFSQALVLREAERFLNAVQEAVNANLGSPATALSAAFDVFLTAAAENPLVRTVVAGEGAEGLLVLFTTHGQPLVESATARLTEMILTAWPIVHQGDAELLSEVLVRLAISYAALPKGPASMGADSVAALLGPYVERRFPAGGAVPRRAGARRA
ncbi:MAG TPA: TetR family transcriptional regulator [Solirubrobacteraceae bacterium]|nr:TetR family transcriptional regulator [Solirubrobacteraceae bacterium]HME04837.1 TetR family transcriptional regulator [Solirubrobacteraceae bacterium]